MLGFSQNWIFGQKFDFSNSVLLFTFRKFLFNCNIFINWLILITDDLSQPQVLIAVQSAPQNAKLRNEVRRTWGDTCRSIHQAWCSLIFVLGSLSSESENQNSSDLQSEILQESGKYGDILQENFDDSYNNLTIKSIYILKYFVSEAEDQNQFLLKTDDDSFVHLEALWDLAKSRLEKKSNNLMGYLQLGLKKHHYLPLAHKPTKSNLQKNGKWLKWLIPTYMYNKRFFPQFLSGSGYLVTKSAATCLLQKSKVLFHSVWKLTKKVSNIKFKFLPL